MNLSYDYDNNVTGGRLGKRGQRLLAWIAFIGLTAAVWAIAAYIAWWMLSGFYGWASAPPDYDKACRENLIVWSGYQECYRDHSCQLGDNEMYAMYQANKAALINCKRQQAILTLPDFLGGTTDREVPPSPKPEFKTENDS